MVPGIGQVEIHYVRTEPKEGAVRELKKRYPPQSIYVLNQISELPRTIFMLLDDLERRDLARYNGAKISKIG